MNHRRNRAATHVEVLVAIVLILLLAAYGLAARRLLKEVDRQKACGANLRQIGQALLLYSNENKNAFPRTYFDGKKDPPVPTWGTPYEGNQNLVVPDHPVDPFAKADAPDADYRPKPNDVTAALYMLMRTQEIASTAFVCPSTGQGKFEFGGGEANALMFTNWPGNKAIRESLSYSYANPYPSKLAMSKGYKLTNALSPEFALAADMNPGGEGLAKLAPGTAPEEMKRVGNSLNHDREGQNVLYVDGHVAFVDRPFVGSKGDNIYTYGDSGQAFANKGGEGVAGAPVGPDDSVLLPSAADVGLKDFPNRPSTAPAKPMTPAEMAAARRRIVGEYQPAAPMARTVRLELTAEKMIMSSGPMTITFSYKVLDVAPDGVVVRLSAPDTPEVDAVLTPGGDERLTIEGVPPFDGVWQRKL